MRTVVSHGLALIVVGMLVSFESTARAEPPKNACVATCEGGELTAESRTKVAALVEPTLQTIRSCLAANGKGDAVRPIVVATIDGAGGVRTVQITQIVAGGQEKLACMPKTTGVARAGAPGMLCDLSCDGSAPRPSAPVPASAPASDAPPPGAATTPKPETKSWYGWQTLIADGTALGLWITAGVTQSGGVAGFGLLVYALVPPVIHVVHGRIGPAFGSLGMRVLAPIALALIGGFVGAVIDDDKGEWGSAEGIAGGVLIGGLVGYGSAVAIDAALLSYEKVEDKSPPVPKPQAIRLRPSLVLTPTPHGGFLGAGGLSGTF